LHINKRSGRGRHLTATEKRGQMPSYGERPGAGTYVCPHDGQRVILMSDDDTLTECPDCGGSEYLLVERKSLAETTDAPPRLVANLGCKEVSTRAAGEGYELDALSQ
jgi:hypothetical protein